MSDIDPVIEATLADFAYVVPRQAFIYKEQGAWRLETLVNREGIHHYLIARGWSPELANSVLKTKQYLTVVDIVMEPNLPPLFKREGMHYINTWVPPTIKAVPLPDGRTIRDVAPCIYRIIDFLTNSDETGAHWLEHWMAIKVQNPSLVPKVAVVALTQPGGGKGTLASIIFQMLGKENCAIIGRGALESRFNARWVRQLFVLADEVLSADNIKDVSDHLKVLIDSAIIELEGKGTNQKAIPNRLAFLFASNDAVTPVRLDQGDRRYTVFANHSRVTEEHKGFLLGLFDPLDKKTPTPAFMTEIEYFYHYLLALDVDRALVASPYQNEARQALIDANKASYEMFFAEATYGGIDALLEPIKAGGDFELIKSWGEYDFGLDGVSKELLYKAYQVYAKRTGTKEMRFNKFCAALKNASGWALKAKKNSAGKKVDCYKAPRG